jgi:hypothetical protein
MAYTIYVQKHRLECEGGSGHTRSSAFLDLAATPGIDLNRHFDFEDDNQLGMAKADLRSISDYQLLCRAGRAIYADSRSTRIVRCK